MKIFTSLTPYITICIPPGNEMLVEGKVSKKERRFKRSGTFMLEPKLKFENHEKLCNTCFDRRIG
jgi:hypothetical protein